jgi:predicted nucleic acid-binding protein
VDANILFAALIKKGHTELLLFNPKLKLIAPSYLFDELEKHKEVILKKTARSRDDLNNTLQDLRSIINMVPKERYEAELGKANLISPDPGDADYFALALKTRIPIWSNDKALKQQDSIKILTTKELINAQDDN